MTKKDKINKTPSILRRRPVLSSIAVFIIMLFVSLAGFYVFYTPHNQIDRVVIDDSTGKINSSLITSELDKIKTRKDVNVLVHVTEGDAASNWDAETYEYIKKSHPELIDGNYWTDGWMIITLNITSGDAVFGSGQVGTYFGEDVKISYNSQQTAQQAAYDNFHQVQWNDGIVNIVNSASGKLGVDSPPYGKIIYVTVAFVFLLILFATLVQYVLNVRKIEKAKKKSKNVYTDVIAAKSEADAVLVGSYGSIIHEKYDDLIQRLVSLMEKIDGTERISNLQLFLEHSPANIISSDLSDIDKEFLLIKDAITLLGKKDDWKSVWNNQLSPLKRELHKVTSENEYNFSSQDLKTVQSIYNDLKKLEQKLFNDKIDMNEALTGVSRFYDRFSEISRRYGEDKMNTVSSSQSSYVKRAVNNAYQDKKHSFDNLWFVYAVVYMPYLYNEGYSVGIRDYQNSLSSSSSSSSSSGFSTDYGSSSGGFSGSGSSSSF